MDDSKLEQNLTENFWDKSPILRWTGPHLPRRNGRPCEEEAEKQKKNTDTRHKTLDTGPNRQHTARSQTSIMKECQLPLRTTSGTPSRHSPLTRCCSLHGRPRKFPRYTQHQLGSHPVVRSHPDHCQRARGRSGLHRGHGQDRSEPAPSE